MLLRFIPLITGLLPIAAIHGSYWIAIQAARVPSCIPYISGCTSISATGRYPPASYLFKAVLLPEAILLILYWLLAVAWLRALSRQTAATVSRFASLDIVLAGTGGAFALILYVTFLGTQEAFYEVMRRFGIYVYFLLTIAAQLLLALRVRRLARQQARERLLRLATAQWLLALAPVVLGVLNAVLKAALPAAGDFDNSVEWLAALAMQLNIGLSYFAWTDSGFEARFTTARR